MRRMSDPGSLLKKLRVLTYSTEPGRLLHLLRDLREMNVCVMWPMHMHLVLLHVDPV